MMKKFVSLLALFVGFALQAYADKVTGSITPPMRVGPNTSTPWFPALGTT